MRLVYQTRFGGPDDPVEKQGNCFAACVASLLGLQLEEAEIYMVGLDTLAAVENRWWQAFVDWCAERDLVPLWLPWGDKATPEQYAGGRPGLRYIVCGQSARGLGHAVVYLDGKLDHDPHPDGGGLVSGSVDAYVVLVRKL